jgi:hypothetical protein
MFYAVGATALNDMRGRSTTTLQGLLAVATPNCGHPAPVSRRSRMVPRPWLR